MRDMKKFMSVFFVNYINEISFRDKIKKKNI